MIMCKYHKKTMKGEWEMDIFTRNLSKYKEMGIHSSKVSRDMGYKGMYKE